MQKWLLSIVSVMILSASANAEPPSSTNFSWSFGDAENYCILDMRYETDPSLQFIKIRDSGDLYVYVSSSDWARLREKDGDTVVLEFLLFDNREVFKIWKKPDAKILINANGFSSYVFHFEKKDVARFIATMKRAQHLTVGADEQHVHTFTWDQRVFSKPFKCGAPPPKSKSGIPYAPPLRPKSKAPTK